MYFAPKSEFVCLITTTKNWGLHFLSWKTYAIISEWNTSDDVKEKLRFCASFTGAIPISIPAATVVSLTFIHTTVQILWKITSNAPMKIREKSHPLTSLLPFCQLYRHIHREAPKDEAVFLKPNLGKVSFLPAGEFFHILYTEFLSPLGGISLTRKFARNPLFWADILISHGRDQYF